jgi:hypothetical protein
MGMMRRTRDLIPAEKDGQTVAIARVQGLIDVTVVDIKSGSVCRGRIIGMACGSIPALGESTSPHMY